MSPVDAVGDGIGEGQRGAGHGRNLRACCDVTGSSSASPASPAWPPPASSSRASAATTWTTTPTSCATGCTTASATPSPARNERRARGERDAGGLSAPQPRTISATCRTVAASPPISSVVTIDSRHASRSWRILSAGPISASSSISFVGTRRRGLVLLAVEVEVLDDLAPRPRSPSAPATSWWKFAPARAHAAEVERVHRAHHVGGLPRRRRGRSPARSRRPRSRPTSGARPRARSPPRARRGRGPRGAGEKNSASQPSRDLGRQRDVLRALGGEVDRDVLAHRVQRRLQRLAEPDDVLAPVSGSG